MCPVYHTSLETTAICSTEVKIPTKENSQIQEKMDCYKTSNVGNVTSTGVSQLVDFQSYQYSRKEAATFSDKHQLNSSLSLNRIQDRSVSLPKLQYENSNIHHSKFSTNNPFLRNTNNKFNCPTNWLKPYYSSQTLQPQAHHFPNNIYGASYIYSANNPILINRGKFHVNGTTMNDVQNGTISCSLSKNNMLLMITCSSTNYCNNPAPILTKQNPVYNCHPLSNKEEHPSNTTRKQLFVYPQKNYVGIQRSKQKGDQPLMLSTGSPKKIIDKVTQNSTLKEKKKQKATASVKVNYKQRVQKPIGPQKKWSDSDTKLLLKLCSEQKRFNQRKGKKREIDWTTIARIFRERGGIRNAHYSSCKQKYERETGYVKISCIKELTLEQQKFLLDNKHCLNKVDVGRRMRYLFLERLPLHRDQVRNFTASLIRVNKSKIEESMGNNSPQLN